MPAKGSIKNNFLQSIVACFDFHCFYNRFQSCLQFPPDMCEPKPPNGFVSPKGEKKSITEPLFFFDLTGGLRLAFSISTFMFVLHVLAFAFAFIKGLVFTAMRPTQSPPFLFDLTEWN